MDETNQRHSTQAHTRGWMTRLIWASLALLAAATAIVVIRQSTAMSGGMRSPAGTMGLSLPLFLLLWVPMMAAMMLLSIAPFASLAARMLMTGPFAMLEILLLIAGYLGIWTLAGIPAYIVLLGADAIMMHTPGATLWVTVILLLIAGMYQWLPLKRMCLLHCRSPLAFLMHITGMNGPWRGLYIGMRHGSFCLGCCWGLMLALLALGMMNVALMAIFAITIFVEKTWRFGIVFGRIVGGVLVLLAVTILLHPDILSSFP